MRPFFTSNHNAYEGSILAIFPKYEVNLEKCCNYLNSLNWNELGFKCGNRFIFNQKSLENCLIPSDIRNNIDILERV